MNELPTNPPALRQDWRWLDRVIWVDPDERVLEGRRLLEANEWYFYHHFPGFPVLPGVLLLEAMAHTAGVLQTLKFLRRDQRLYNYVLMSLKDARFYRFAKAGDELVMTAEIEHGDCDQTLAKVHARVDGSQVARATFMLHRVEPAELGAESVEAAALSDPFGARQYLLDVLDPLLFERFGLPDSAQATGRKTSETLA